jgi:amidase
MHHWLRALLMSIASLAGLRAAEPVFPFAEATIDGLQAQMGAGRLTARALTDAYLRRIDTLDRHGPQLRAVIELNPDAPVIADALDAERRAGRVRGPLHGIPILLKDNIATTDRMETTAGSLALVGQRPSREAPLVTRLRAAGAIILGKTNLSEWANFRGERSISGWSARGGQTLNPYALDRSPSGSSSGSAVAVAANLCVAAIGTETSGSIISPSAACGVVGFKPTVGLVSRGGVIPIAASFDTAGPITRTVRDAALVLAALAGTDERDSATRAQPSGLPAELARSLRSGALRGARIGWMARTGFRPSLEREQAVALAALQAAGAEVIPVSEIKGLGTSDRPQVEVMLYEMKAGIDAYLADLAPGSAMPSLAAVIAFNDANRSRELALFGQQYFERAQAKGPLTDPAYLAARAACRRLAGAEGIDALVAQHRLDALVTVVSAPARLIAPPAGGDPLFGPAGPGGGGPGGPTPAAMAGYPSVTVPLAQVAGLPVGLLFYGPAWSEVKLLELAAAFEQQVPARREPAFRATAGE